MDRRRILIAGIGASLALAMWEMIVEAVIPDGAGFWRIRSPSMWSRSSWA